MGSKFSRVLVKSVALIDRISVWAGLLSGIAAVLMMLFTVQEVFMRYFLNRPGQLAYEGTMLLMVAVLFLGLAYVLQEGGHVKVDFIINRAPQSMLLPLKGFGNVLGFAFFGILVWYGWKMTWQAYQMGFTEPIGIPSFLVLVLIPIGSFLICLQYLSLTYHDIVSRPGKGPSK